MDLLRLKSWPPFVAGAGIGVLCWLTFATVDKPLGVSTAFEHTAAIVLRSAAPSVAHSNAYFSDPEKTPRIGWEWMLVLGIFIGSWISSSLSGDREKITVPREWAASFGGSTSLRFAGAFAGGGLMMFGARMAGGCTSGHGISGVLQLAVASWMFFVVFFLTGIVAAHLLYGRGGYRV